MEVIFGEKRVVIDAGITKDGQYVCKLQRVSKEMTQEDLDSGQWKKYIDNSPAILIFQDIKGLNKLIDSLKFLKRCMYDDALEKLEKEYKEEGGTDGQIQ